MSAANEVAVNEVKLKEGMRTPLSDLLNKNDLSPEQVEIEVKEILERNPEWAAVPDPNNRFPLQLAVDHKFFNVAELLIQKGADVNSIDARGLTPLLCSVMEEDIESIKFWLSHGADVNFAFHDSDDPEDVLNPLNMAVVLENTQIVQLLLDGGADIVYRSLNHWDALRSACTENEETDILELLISHGADVNHEYSKNTTVINYSLVTNRFNHFKFLINHGADVKKRGDMPLLLRVFLDVTKPISPVKKNAREETPEELLTHSRIRYHFPKVQVKHLSMNDKKARFCRCYDADWKQLSDLILEKGYDINEGIKFRIGGDERLSDLLLTMPFLVHTSSFGPLLASMPRKQGTFFAEVSKLFSGVDPTDYFEYLLDRGLNPNTFGTLQPFLLLCVNAGSDELAKALIKHGADVNVRNKEGRNALHMIDDDNEIKIAKLLIEKGADVNCPDSKGRTPLHHAACVGTTGIARLLIDNRAAVNCMDNDGCTPLHLAVREGNDEMVDLLIERGADASIINNTGKTAFDMVQDEKKPSESKASQD